MVKIEWKAPDKVTVISMVIYFGTIAFGLWVSGNWK